MCNIISDRIVAIEAGKRSIIRNRKLLEDYCVKNPYFQHSLEPLIINNGPRVVKLMAEASQKAGVGPMASVAGVLADLAVEEMLAEEACVAVVENGGEAALQSDRCILVVVQAGNTPLSKRIGFKVEEFPVGIATSSGKYSHALSFGDSDAVTVFAESSGLADAAATAIGNVVSGGDHVEAVKIGVEKAQSINGVIGALIIYETNVGTVGAIPPLIKVNP